MIVTSDGKDGCSFTKVCYENIHFLHHSSLLIFQQNMVLIILFLQPPFPCWHFNNSVEIPRVLIPLLSHFSLHPVISDINSRLHLRMRNCRLRRRLQRSKYCNTELLIPQHNSVRLRLHSCCSRRLEVGQPVPHGGEGGSV